MKNKKGNGLMLALFLIFIAAVLQSNFTLAAKEKTINAAETFTPLYPYTEDYQAINKEIAARVGIDLNERCDIKIAVIDSGADVALEALNKNIDIYRDYTEDNMIKLKKARAGAGKVIFCDNKRYYLGELMSKTAVYHIGSLDFKKYPALQMVDEYDILSIVDQGKKAVYIDTDRDRDFSDEEPLGIYEFDQKYVSLISGDKTVNIVCTAIKDNGAKVCLSSDYLGHGSFIAALIGGECAEYQGLAEGSRLFIYQVFASGKAEQTALAQAVRDAVDDGVQIINLSLTLPLEGAVIKELDEALDYALAKNVLIVAAAGNYGGGEGTIGYPARKQGVLAIGTLITKEGYALGRGINLEEDFVPYYSSRADSDYCEFILAPGCAVSALPSWADETYMFDEGSSTAAAVATAALAHAMTEEKDLMSEVLAAFTAAAQPLGYNPHIQGMGLVQADFRETQDYGLKLYREGEYLCVDNPHSVFYEAYFTSDQDTLEVPIVTKIAPCGVSRFLLKENNDNLGKDTMIRLYIGEGRIFTDCLYWQSEGNLPLTDGESRQFSLKAGKSADYYWQVTEKSDIAVGVSLEQLDFADKTLPHGRVAAVIYNPSGEITAREDYFGVSFGEDICSEKQISIKNAESGLWRLSIISGESLPLYNQTESSGSVEIRILK